MYANIPKHLRGLTDEQVKESRREFGFNQMDNRSGSTWFSLFLEIIKEPMLLLLIAVAVIYVIVGNYSEALFMVGAIVAVSAISFYQDNRSKKALEALEKLNEPLSTVIRNSKVVEIPTHEIAVGDLCIIDEGRMINADGKILHSNDFQVNESSLTGESFSVFKSQDSDDKTVFSGTLVVSGLAVFEVEKIGGQTRLGKIGLSLQNIKSQPSPLQIQISKFVRGMAIAGIVVFLLVWLYSYLETRSIVDSLLTGLTLAMSVLPEEIPVAFTTFMALGAWKLMREGVIIKHSTVVETLGSTTVICTDKTGTITVNSMHLKHLYNYQTDKIYEEDDFKSQELTDLISYAMWSSEPLPFDPMEKAIHASYGSSVTFDRRKEFQMVHEYPLSGKPPMMTHIFENSVKDRIIAAKGAPEAILAVSTISASNKEKLRTTIKFFGDQGFRVLGVAKASFPGSEFPKDQKNFEFEFLGFTVFYDPPKKNIREVFQKIYQAGIKVKVITGDNADTTNAIALQAGVINNTLPVNGSEINKAQDDQIRKIAHGHTLFTRMFPEVKLKVVNALKQNGEVVAMLGDGVNDAPALKAAHIGVAMGTKGTEIAKAASSLVITNDDLGKLITGIAEGRRIYTNLKKAVQYIISIHIPIILTVSLPLFLGWAYPNIFTPVHVIFLELIMGPTCSIVYENEPMERNTMLQNPRKLTDTFLNFKELFVSIFQGLMITAGVLFAYQHTLQEGGDEEKTRAIVFSTLIFANVFLSFTNRSFYYSIIESFRYRNRLLVAVTVAALGLLLAILFIKPLSAFFGVTSLTIGEIAFSSLVAAVSVLWFEVYKLVKRSNGES